MQKAFRDAFFILERRISLFLSLPHATIGKLALKKELDKVGQTMLPGDVADQARDRAAAR